MRKKKEAFKYRVEKIGGRIEMEGNKSKLNKEEKEALCELHNTLAREKKKWRKNSIVTWLQAGDRNTRFFKMTTFRY